jgi:hypothetical protein
MFSMMVELANTISSQDGNIEGLAYQKTLFPAPAIKSKAISPSESTEVGGLTFPMNPQKRTLPGQFPFREGAASDKPHCRFGVARFTGKIMIFPWIRWREPTSKLVTCRTTSVIPVSNGNCTKYLTF